MRWHSILVASAMALACSASLALAQNRNDDSFVPVIVERPDTISITTNGDPDILPALRPPPSESASDCIDLKEPRAVEAKTIAAHAKVVMRKGGELQVRLANERTIRLFDIPCGESFAAYFFLDLLPQTGFALVRQDVYEDYYFLAISLSTGRVSKMLDRPVPSPDGKRFATYRYDQMNGITELTLYAARPDRVVAEAACEVVIADAEAGAAVPKWINAETLSFVVSDGSKAFPDGPTLKRQGNDWVLAGPVTFKIDGRERKAFRQICKNVK